MNDIYQAIEIVSTMIEMDVPLEVLQKKLEKDFDPDIVKGILFEAQLLLLQKKNPKMDKAQHEAFLKGEKQGIIKGAIKAISVLLKYGEPILLIEHWYKNEFDPEDFQEILSQAQRLVFKGKRGLGPTATEIYLEGYASGIMPYVKNGSISFERLEEILKESEDDYTPEEIQIVISEVKRLIKEDED